MARDRFQDTLSAMAFNDESESPVERLFHAAFQCFRDRLMVPQSIRLLQQYHAGKYRLDFAAACQLGWIAIEIDGHEFHDRTKEQASRDRARDRDLMAMGFVVIRFTGSDVWNNPILCAKEAADAIIMREFGRSIRHARSSAAIAQIEKLFED